MAQRSRSVGTYDLFVNDIDFITSWIASRAKAFQCPASLLQGENIQQRGGHVAQGSATRRAIPLSNLIPLAKSIHLKRKKKKKTKIPDGVLESLERVVPFAQGLDCRESRPPANDGVDFSCIHEILSEVATLLKLELKIPENDDPYSYKGDLSMHFKNSYGIEKKETMGMFNQRKMFVADDGVTYTAKLPTSRANAMMAMAILFHDLDWIVTKSIRVWSIFLTGIAEIGVPGFATAVAADFGRGLIQQMEPIFEEFGGGCAVLRGLFKHWATESELSSKVADAWWGNGLRECTLVYFGGSSRLYMTLATLDNLMLDPDCLSEEKLLALARKPRIQGKDVERKKIVIADLNEEFITMIQGLFADIVLLIRLVPEYPLQEGLIHDARKFLESGKLSLELCYSLTMYVSHENNVRFDRPFRINNIGSFLTEQMDAAQAEIEYQLQFDARSVSSETDWRQSVNMRMKALKGEMKQITDDPLRRAKQQLAQRLGLPPHDDEKHVLFERARDIVALFWLYFQTRICDIVFSLEELTGAMTSCVQLDRALDDEDMTKFEWWDLKALERACRGKCIFNRRRPDGIVGRLAQFLCLHRALVTQPEDKLEFKPWEGGSGLRERPNPYGVKEEALVLGGLLDDFVHQSSSTLSDRIAKMIESGMGPPETGRPSEVRLVSGSNLLDKLCLKASDQIEPGLIPLLVVYRGCVRFLRYLRANFDDILRPGYAQSDNELAFVVGQIFLSCSSKDSRDWRGCEDHMAHVAARVMDTFLGRHLGGVAGKFLEEGFIGSRPCRRVRGERMFDHKPAALTSLFLKPNVQIEGKRGA